MRIVVERSGGYAGGRKTADIDTSRLDPARARQVEQLAGEAVARITPRPAAVGADVLRYDITIQDRGRVVLLSFVDDGSPDAGPMKRLVEEISELPSAALEDAGEPPQS